MGTTADDSWDAADTEVDGNKRKVPVLLSASAASRWFESHSIGVRAAWIESAIEYLGENACYHALLEQFMHSSLSDSYDPPMKIPLAAAKIVLTKRIVFQVVSVLDISRSVYSQFREATRRPGSLTWFHRDEDEGGEEGIWNSMAPLPSSDVPFDEDGKVELGGGEGGKAGWKKKASRCLKLQLTDGHSRLAAVEYGSWDELREDIPIGTKIMLSGRAVCRRGTMLLNGKNCVILGGSADGEEDPPTRGEFLLNLLPEEKKEKIQPYLGRIKKDLDLNQKTISPYLVRLPTAGKRAAAPSPLVTTGTGVVRGEQARTLVPETPPSVVRNDTLEWRGGLDSSVPFVDETVPETPMLAAPANRAKGREELRVPTAVQPANDSFYDEVVFESVPATALVGGVPAPTTSLSRQLMPPPPLPPLRALPAPSARIPPSTASTGTVALLPIPRGDPPVPFRVWDTVRQFVLPPAAAVQPIVKIEEEEEEARRYVPPPLERTIDESFSSDLPSDSRAWSGGSRGSTGGRRPIIPVRRGAIDEKVSPAMALLRSSQIIPLEDGRSPPLRPCIRLAPMNGRSSRDSSTERGGSGNRRESALVPPPSKAAAGGGGGAKNVSSSSSSSGGRSIVSYFSRASQSGTQQSEKGGKKTQLVEPSARPMHTTFEDARAHHREAEMLRQKEEATRRAREEDERFRREEEARSREREARAAAVEKQRQLLTMERLREEHEAMMQGRNTSERGTAQPTRHPSLSYIVSTPAPTSYVTPPAGFHPPGASAGIHGQAGHYAQDVSSPAGDPSSFLFAPHGLFAKTSPKEQFSSPARSYGAPEIAVVPYKRQRGNYEFSTHDQRQPHQAFEGGAGGRRGFPPTGGECGAYGGGDTAGRGGLFDPPPPSSGSHSASSTTTGRALFAGDSAPFGDPFHASMGRGAVCQQVPRSMASSMIPPPSRARAVEDTYFKLPRVVLRDVLGQRRYWMISKTFIVVPLRCRVPRDLRAEHGVWLLHLELTDESGDVFRCIFDTKALEAMLGFGVRLCQGLSIANDRSELIKLKQKAMRLLKSFERLDLVLTLEVSSQPGEDPVIMQIQTLSDALQVS